MGRGFLSSVELPKLEVYMGRGWKLTGVAEGLLGGCIMWDFKVSGQKSYRKSDF